MIDLTLVFEDGTESQKQSSKSALFKLAAEAGMTTAEIAKESNSHYSFVYGVLKKINLNTASAHKAGYSDQIRQMYKEGATVGQIAKELGRNYSFVFGVVKRYRETDPEMIALEAQKSAKVPTVETVNTIVPDDLTKDTVVEEKVEEAKVEEEKVEEVEEAPKKEKKSRKSKKEEKEA